MQQTAIPGYWTECLVNEQPETEALRKLPGAQARAAAPRYNRKALQRGVA